MNPFQGPMRPFPGLERWSRQVRLPDSELTLHLYDTGGEARPPVLLLHGLGDEADTWRHVLPRLQAGFRGIAPDLPGFGRSDQGKHKYTVPFFVETMRELLDALSIPRAVLVGHSTGAVIAHTFALEYPERVQRLVLVGGSLVSKENKLNRDLLFFLIPGLGEWAYTRLRGDPQAAYRSLEAYYHRLDNLPQAERDFLYQRVNERVWSDGQRRGFLATLRGLVSWLPGQQKALPTRLRGWKTPTTVVWGAEDQISPAVNARALKDLLPSARLVIVPGAGHNVQQEQAEIVAAAVTEAAVTEAAVTEAAVAEAAVAEAAVAEAAVAEAAVAEAANAEAPAGDVFPGG